MSGRNRLYCAALGGCLAGLLWVSPGLTQEAQDVAPPVSEGQPVPEGRDTPGEKRGANDGSEKESATEQLTPALNQIEAAIRDLITQERASQSQDPTDHEKRDLQAQEGMALWAEAMFWATLAAVVLTFVGIFLIWRTLHHTRRAADYAGAMAIEARATTKAAEQTIEVTRLSNERQLRAYMFVEGGRRWRRSDSDPWEYHLAIKNFGKTPAYKFKLQIACELIPADKVDSFNFGALGPPQGEVVLGPEHAHTIRDKIPGLGGDGWRRFKTGELRLFLWGRIDYVDAFGKDRWTRFRLYQFGSYHLEFANYRIGNDTSENQEDSQ